ncbi:Protein GRISEA [Ceratocystis lukuohia]|uniref:Protein GRISEA n=1 Tax=Ceratocystis lukuohia TaxID=2019550 RepID=A0ABR4MBM8_9PEZI
MPIIDGIKMACVPCIRGHRSTKCNHASERVMVPVRKPGRPLSICPHPSTKPCACGVTAAIPKKSTCSCSPSGSKAEPCASKSVGAGAGAAALVPASSPTPAPDPAPGPGPAPAASSSSISAQNGLPHTHIHNPQSNAVPPTQLASQLRPTNGASPPIKTISAPGSGRIQKAQPPKSTRKYSFDPSVLHRIDVNHTNIVSPVMAFDTANCSPQTQTPTMPLQPQLPPQLQTQQPHLQSLSYNPNPMLSDQASQITVPMMMSMYLPTMSGSMMSQMPGHVTDSPSASPTTTRTTNTNAYISSPHVGQQRPQSIKLESDSRAHEQALSSPSSSPSEAIAPKKGCCNGGGKKSPAVPAKPVSATITPTSMPGSGGQQPPNTAVPTTASSGPGDMHMNAFYSPFAYPPQIGSLIQPLSPEQWRLCMDSHIAAQTHAARSQHETESQSQTPNPMLNSTFGGLPVQLNHPGSLSQSQPPGQPHGQPQPLYHVPPPPPDAQPCTCGDTCQCLGCWWHPYNQTTTDQVMSAYNAMWGDSVFDADPVSAAAVKSPVTSAGNGGCCAGEGSNGGRSAGGTTNNGNGNSAPTGTHEAQSHSPVSAGGSSIEEQNLSADTFLFVHYPIHGCVVHGN